MSTQIPAARVPMTDPNTGLISREWYIFFFGSLSTGATDGGEFLSHIVEVTSSFSPDNFTHHIRCSGTLTISLQSYLNRDSILSITNAGTGVVTIKAASGETIKNEAQIELDFQWTTVQLCPRILGWDII